MRINANTIDPGCYIKKSGNYDVIFYNPITHEKEIIATNKLLKDATAIYLKKQLEFYSNHTYLLPKFIVIQKGKFVVRIQYKVNFDNNFKQIYLGCFDSLQAAEKAKIDFLTSLI